MFHWAVIFFAFAILSALFGSSLWIDESLSLPALVVGLLLLFHPGKPPRSDSISKAHSHKDRVYEVRQTSRRRNRPQTS